MNLAFSAAGRLLGTVVGTNGPVRLWDAKTGEERATLRETDSQDRVIQMLAFSPDGRYLAVGSHNGFITVWDPSRLEARARFESRDSVITALAFAPDSRTLAIGQSSGEIRFLDIETGLSRQPLPVHRRMITNLVFSPDGAWLAWNDENTLRLCPVSRCLPSRKVGAAGVVERLSEGPGEPDALVELAEGQQSGVAGELGRRRLTDQRRAEGVRDLSSGGWYNQ